MREIFTLRYMSILITNEYHLFFNDNFFKIVYHFREYLVIAKNTTNLLNVRWQSKVVLFVDPIHVIESFVYIQTLFTSYYEISRYLLNTSKWSLKFRLTSEVWSTSWLRDKNQSYLLSSDSNHSHHNFYVWKFSVMD